MPIREWLWWPASRSHALACGVTLMAVTLLGLAGVPHFPAFKDFDDMTGSAASFAVWSVLLVVANAGVFAIAARGDYMQLSSGLRPMMLTFAVLTVLFPLAVGASRLAAGRAVLASPFDADRRYVAKIVFVGEGGLSLVLAISGLWKPTAPETQEVMAMLDLVRPDLRRVFSSRPPGAVRGLSKEEAQRLRLRLDLLAEKSAKLISRPLLARDHAFAERVATSAAFVRAKLERPEIDLTALRDSDDSQLKSSVQALLATS